MELEKSYLKYANGKLDKDSFKDNIIEYAYKEVQKDRYIEAGDFIVTFIPKVDNIIDNFNIDLASFHHYINKHIKWLMFSFCKQYTKNKEKNEAIYYNQINEYDSMNTVSESIGEYKISSNAIKLLNIINGKIIKKSVKKRLLIFLLKNSRSLNIDQINVFAPIIDISPEWLFLKKEELCSLCNKRIKNREYLKQRYVRLFLEITKEQDKLNKIEFFSNKQYILESIEKKQIRKNQLEELIKNRHCGPKNEEIAKILSIPKGTVDSSLYYLKKDLESLLPDSNMH